MTMIEMVKSAKAGKLRKLVLTLVVSVGMMGIMPDLARAATIPANEAGPAGMRAENLAKIRAVLERKEVAAKLSDYGLTPAEVSARLDQLTDEQASEFAAQIDQINYGGASAPSDDKDKAKEKKRMDEIAGWSALGVLAIIIIGGIIEWIVEGTKEKKNEKQSNNPPEPEPTPPNPPPVTPQPPPKVTIEQPPVVIPEDWRYVPVSLAACGAINDIVEDQAGTMYAATGACGVLKSGDGGRTWDKTGWAQGSVLRLFYLDGVLWALCQDRLLFSNDGGGTWTAAIAPESGLHYTCGAMPGGGIIYLGTTVGLFASSDGGKTWRLITTRGQGVHWITCGNDPWQVVVIFDTGRTSCSCSGEHWTQWTDFDTDPGNKRIFVIYYPELTYFLVRQDGRLLRCANPPACAGGWTVVTGITGAVQWVGCMDKDCHCLGVLTSAGLYQSCDGGRTWEFVPSTECGKPITFTPRKGGGVIIGGGEGSICTPHKIEQKKSLGDVNFKTGKADLTPEAKAILDELVGNLKSHPEFRARVEGYTDSVGRDDSNLDLSQRRADSVKNYLVSKGIAPERIQTKGYGRQNPIASNATAEGKAKNRRVEVFILK